MDSKCVVLATKTSTASLLRHRYLDASIIPHDATFLRSRLCGYIHHVLVEFWVFALLDHERAGGKQYCRSVEYFCCAT